MLAESGVGDRALERRAPLGMRTAAEDERQPEALRVDPVLRGILHRAVGADQRLLHRHARAMARGAMPSLFTVLTSTRATYVVALRRSIIVRRPDR